ncbi:DUF4214 domain-containing protein [Ectothiorhodospira variabilis]|uniref:DUF4214 domain-containing protein n=1 Tax=Ectothiorhodospira variabilis TaxID=505694 RepID=UPI001EFC148B|nr:DUF4214 domain-containing protein [Ectothiorhodospira variabilis]MCG5495693.1 DUF4214 domain-containing protein [Ectothiorhodospira variabilis]MCG5496577.1 DUF4214 domain-containing protein [Ectothiorhodospira variabilis]MCG5504589.1 DUF4214 domain-containing protein [Ectothiorhodospira variabilis]MCG5507703.1 DUF4214 domain-containing protein [Ectothiorhodospira variabilis]
MTPPMMALRSGRWWLYPLLLLVLSCLPASLLAAPAERQETRWQVVEVYMATLGYAPDADGVRYWEQQLANPASGWELTSVASSFFDQPLVQQRYPDRDDHERLIEALYQNVFGRGADDEGMNYWLNEIQAGRIRPNEMIIAMINGAWDNPEAAADVARFENRTRASLAFVEHQEAQGIHYGALSEVDQAALRDAGRNLLETVTGDPASLELARGQVPTLLASFQPPVPDVPPPPADTDIVHYQAAALADGTHNRYKAAALDVAALAHYLVAPESTLDAFYLDYLDRFSPVGEVEFDPGLSTGEWRMSIDCPREGLSYREVLSIQSRYRVYDPWDDYDDDDYDEDWGPHCHADISNHTPIAPHNNDRVLAAGDYLEEEITVDLPSVKRSGIHRLWVEQGFWSEFGEALAEDTRVVHEFERVTMSMSQLPDSIYLHGRISETVGWDRLVMATPENHAFWWRYWMPSWNLGDAGRTVALQFQGELTKQRECPYSYGCWGSGDVTGSGQLGGPSVGGSFHFEVQEPLQVNGDFSAWPQLEGGAVIVRDASGAQARISFTSDGVTVTGPEGAVTSSAWSALCQAHGFSCNF